MKRVFPTFMTLAAIVVLVFGFAELSEGQRDGRDRGRNRFEGPIDDFPLTALPRDFAAPPDNPQTPHKVELGRLLFWDPILSGNRQVACATCHHPDFAYAEDLDLSIGVDGAGLGGDRRFVSPDPIPFVKRNSQTILNTAFNGIDLDGGYDPAMAPMFWDVRALGLEAQALAAFQRSLIANNSPYDRYMRGETNAMTRLQIRGMQQFEQVGCINCHNGPMFSDYELHVLGIRDNRLLAESDVGAIEQPYAFRTPSLRNLAYTAPYMHNGLFATLEDVVEFYDDVGDRNERNVNLQRNQMDPLTRTLDDPDNHERELIAFLNALNDDNFDRKIPDRVPSGLNPGGEI